MQNKTAIIVKIWYPDFMCADYIVEVDDKEIFRSHYLDEAEGFCEENHYEYHYINCMDI